MWHNYGFDRHVFHNHGINVRGFGGDTMHMARLFDASKMFGEYALASLTKDYQKGIKDTMGKYLERKANNYKERYENPKLSEAEKK